MPVPAEPPPGPRSLGLVVGRQLTLRGFLVSDHGDLRAEATEATEAIGNTGQMVVRLAPDPDWR